MQPDAKDKFMACKTAYQTLIDEAQRKKYDRTMEVPFTVMNVKSIKAYLVAEDYEVHSLLCLGDDLKLAITILLYVAILFKACLPSLT